jgi:hypothetical protein
MLEGIAYLMLPGIVIFFAFIVLERVVEMFLRLIDFVRGRFG